MFLPCNGLDLRMMRLYSYIYQNLDAAFTIVHALDGFDEISLTGRSKITNNRGEYVYEPSDFNFNKLEIEELSGGNTVANAAEIFTNVLDNQATDAQTNVVLINAALAIQTLEFNKTIEECVAISKESIESGKAKLAFTKFLKHYSV